MKITINKLINLLSSIGVARIFFLEVYVLFLQKVGDLFTALHLMQTRSSDENSVCPSVRPPVCLSVKRVNFD